MNTNTDLTIVIDVEDKFTHVMHKIETKARDTKKELDQSMLFKLKADVAGLDIQLKEARAKLRKATSHSEKFKLTLDTQDLQRNLTEAKRKLNNYLNTGDANISRLQAKFDGLKGLWGSASNWMYGGIIAVLGTVTKGVTQLGDSLEQARISFTTMLGSAQQANTFLSELSQFAKGTPFGLSEVRENAKQLLAMNIQASRVIPTLKMLGDVSAGLSVPLQRLALNYGQVMVKGHLAGQELKDFTTAGVPLLDELSKNLKKSKSEIQSMISKGQISANDVTQAFETMTSEGGKFANLMAQQSATLSGLWSNFMDILSQVGERLGTAIIPALKTAVQWMNKFLEKPQNQYEEAIQHTEKEISELQQSLDETRQSLTLLHSDFMNGKISTEYFGLESKRLTALLQEEEKALTALNTQYQRQQDFLNLSTKLHQEYADVVADFHQKQQALEEQINSITEQEQKGLLTTEEASRQKKMLTNQLDTLTVTMNEQEQAFKKEQVLAKAAAESNESFHAIKEMLTNLKIDNADDLNALNSEQIQANKTAKAYMEVAKAKAQANMLNLEGKIKKNSFIHNTIVGSGKAIGAMVGFFSATGAYTGAKKGRDYGTKLSTKLGYNDVTRLKEQYKKAQDELKTIEEITNNNAFIVGRKKKTTKPNSAPSAINDTELQKAGRAGGGSAKSRTKELAQELEKQKALEIKAVQESEATEEEKFQKLQAIKVKYDKKRLELEKKTDDALLKQAEQYMKKMEKNRADTVKDHQKMGEQAMKDVEKYKEKLTSVKEKFDEIKTKATETIREIQHEIQILDVNHITKLGERYYEVSKQIRDAEKESRELKSYTQSHTLQQLEEMEEQGYSTIGNIDIDKLIQHIRLKEELLLLEQQVSQEQREQATINANKSETTKLLEQYKQEKQALEEKQAIIQAINNTELGQKETIKLEGNNLSYWNEEKKQRSAIIDHKNAEYARDLLNQQQKLNSEYEANQQHLKKSQLLVVSNSRAILNIRKQETLSYQHELEERATATRTYVNNIKSMMSELAQARRSASNSTVVNNNNQVTNSNNRTTNHTYTIVHKGPKRPLPLVGIK